MGGTTTVHGLRYPAGGDPANGLANYFFNLASDVDAQLPVVASSAPTPKPGLIWRNSTTGLVQISDGSSWFSVSGGLLYGETVGTATVNLTAASTGFAMTDTRVGFVLATQRRVRVVSRFTASGGAANAILVVNAATVAGGTATLSGATTGAGAQVSLGTTGGPGQTSVATESTFLLAAGTYSGFTAATCTTGTTSAALAGYCAVYDAGPT